MNEIVFRVQDGFGGYWDVKGEILSHAKRGRAWVRWPRRGKKNLGRYRYRCIHLQQIVSWPDLGLDDETLRRYLDGCVRG